MHNCLILHIINQTSKHSSLLLPLLTFVAIALYEIQKKMKKKLDVYSLK